MTNPLLDFSGLPRFDEIRAEHIAPAIDHLLAEAEAGMRQVGMARLRLADGCYGVCQRCGEVIEPARLQALPAAEFCLSCADRAGV